MSSKQEAIELFRRINLDSKVTATMFGPDRGKENPLLSKLEPNDVEIIDAVNGNDKEAKNNKQKGHERPRLADALSVHQTERDRHLIQNAPTTGQIKHISVHSKRLS